MKTVDFDSFYFDAQISLFSFLILNLMLSFFDGAMEYGSSLLGFSLAMWFLLECFYRTLYPLLVPFYVL